MKIWKGYLEAGVNILTVISGDEVEPGYEESEEWEKNKKSSFSSPSQ